MSERNQAILENEATTEQLEQVMRKYDKESAIRYWAGTPEKVVRIIMAVFSLYCIWSTLFFTADLPIRLTSFLGLITIMGYLTYPASKHNIRSNYMPWYDILLMVLGASSFFYYCFRYNSLVRIITSASKMTPFYVAVGIVGILCLAELCRRCVGVPILFVVGALLIYTFASGQSLNRIIYTLFYGTSGVLATPVQVCAKFIAVFIIFGAFLERTGIANFFIALANAAAGGTSGGPAKVAVISSALCGMVSGSSVGNTVTTGSVTIPMMKDTGYQPEFAGAVEAAASTGGQIMPPIMGAAAFLMAEYMGITYGRVALMAILPAVLYFSGIFISVHLEAKRLGLRGISKEQLPKFRNLLPQSYLLLPLVLLVWLVSANVRSLQFSASLAIAVAILVSIPQLVGVVGKEKKGAAASAGSLVYKLGHMSLLSLEGGGRGCISVAVACSMAGLVAGCITVTGLASRLVSAIVSVSSSIPNQNLALLFALVLTMLCCIVLGMGVPTTANYSIMASTCAPILITLGIPKVAAHFFVFYFGIVADITPPVALAAYAGAAIAKANPMKTGITATKLAIAAFIVPYIFSFSPTLLTLDTGFFSAAEAIFTSLLGIFGLAIALNGFLFRKINWIFRLLSVVGGLTLLYPGLLSDLIGLVILGGVVLFQWLGAKRQSQLTAVS